MYFLQDGYCEDGSGWACNELGILLAEHYDNRGRAAMEFTEDEARRRGITKVSLNVFGGNDVARSLYLSLGYRETAIYMEKPL